MGRKKKSVAEKLEEVGVMAVAPGSKLSEGAAEAVRLRTIANVLDSMTADELARTMTWLISKYDVSDA